MIKVTKSGQIALDSKDFRNTRNIEADYLLCGHYILPLQKGSKYLQDTICPHCNKKTQFSGITIYQDAG